MSSELQQTLAQPVSVAGVGIHSGASVCMRVCPAPAGTGIVFVRTDLPHRPSIPACSSQVIDIKKTMRRTTLSNGGAEVQTVEHVLSALWGLEIDNAYIELDGIETPAMDGSSLPLFSQIKEAGITQQEKPRSYFVLREPIVLQEGEASIAALPSLQPKISYLLDFQHSGIKPQFVTYVHEGPDSYEQQVAPARTFCLKEEAEALQTAGFGKGAGFKNTLVFDQGAVMNNTLKFEDECARHKVLDLIGDLYLLGQRMRAHIYAVKSGHPLNARLLMKLSQLRDQWSAGALQSACSGVMVGPQLDITQIQKILPHRYPFLLVDRVVHLDDQSAVGIKNVSINESFFRGHFPNHPVMPGVLMVEALAQLGGIVMLNCSNNQGKIAYFMAVDKVKFRKPVVPGDQLVLHVQMLKMRSRIAQASGKVFVDDKVVCEGELTFALAE